MKSSSVFTLLVIGLTSLLIPTFSFPDVYASSTISWQQNGFNVSDAGLSWGDVFDTDDPATLRIEDTNLASNSNSDTIDVQISGDQTGDLISITLTETGDSGVFTSQAIILTQGIGRFQTTDTVTVRVQDDDCAGNMCDVNIPDILSGAGEGILIFSDTDLVGIQIDLVETGDNTLIFEGTFNFTSDTSSDSTLQVTEGDVISVVDGFSGELVNALVVPADLDKGAIYAVPFDVEEIIVNTYFVTASYDSVSDGTVISSLAISPDNPPGRGGGGLIRPGLVVDEPSSGSNNDGSGNGGAGCSGDCTPPTLGLNSHEKRIVENGFSYNGNPVDVELFYTPYPLITTEVGKENVAVLKLFENGGTSNLEHVELAFGLRSGQVIGESKAVINWDRTFDRREHVSMIDPENSLENVRVVVERGRCSSIDVTPCTILNIFHTFRTPLDFNIVGTNVWDFDRNAWQNFYNHGIEVVGESLNPPKEYNGINKGQIYHLTETSKTTAIDEFGYSWTLKYNKWYKDYVGEKVQDTGNIKNRNHSAFSNWKQEQAEMATSYFDSSKIQSTLDEPFRYEYPSISHREQSLLYYNNSLR